MTKKIVIPYFPKGLKYASPLLIFVAIYLLVEEHYVWGIVLTLLGLMILTTNYVTKIDLKERKYYDYLVLLGFHVNKENKKFTTLHAIIITKGNYAQTINTRVQSRQLDWSDYTGTLIFDDNKTLDLLTRNDKKELIHGLKEFAQFLNVPIEDRSTNHYYMVDLSQI